jgi:hypothetical protein
MIIAGNESALAAAIETEAARRVEQYALALIPDRFSANSQKAGTQPRQAVPEKARVLLDWNPGSPISARTLVLAAENRFAQISEAILVCDPPQARSAAADLGLADIEVLVNDHIKGWFFLVKELAAVFRARGEGTLALVFPESGGSGGKDEAADLLGQAALGAFRSLTHNLLAAALSETYVTMGFSGAETGDEAGFAAFIFKQLDDRNRRGNGKLHKYGKLGFFR